jgi:outer membrane receptor for ferrienterochelin and colicins
MRSLSGSPIMLRKRLLLVQVFLLLMLAVRAQVAVQVVEAVSGAPVPYAHIGWQPLGNGQGQLVVSAPDGKAELPLGPEILAKGVVLRISFLGNATIIDTLWTNAPRTYRMERSSVGLQEVVVTGQYAPGSPDKAVHKVRVLDEAQFKRMAANNLGDALRNELNIRLSQDNVLGTSLSMQGLGGQNVKILVDGVPVVGRQDGNIDLAQLDLTGVERAEIIEGPLSVNYGTNALAGTINLITRKSVASPFSLKASVYAEHIGRLNTTLSGGGKWGRHDLLITAGRNFFGGWDPEQQGVPSFEPAPADMSRYQQWKPREQYFGRVG